MSVCLDVCNILICIAFCLFLCIRLFVIVFAIVHCGVCSCMSFGCAGLSSVDRTQWKMPTHTPCASEKASTLSSFSVHRNSKLIAFTYLLKSRKKQRKKRPTRTAPSSVWIFHSRTIARAHARRCKLRIRKMRQQGKVIYFTFNNELDCFDVQCGYS